MARETTANRLDRAIKLAVGLCRPEIAVEMMEHGLQQSDLDELGAHLAVLIRLPPAPLRRVDPTKGMLRELAAWGKHWVPIVEATLRRRWPDVWSGLSSDVGDEPGSDFAAFTFVQRLRTLAASSDPVDREARAMLARRGLSDAVLTAAVALAEASLRSDPTGMSEQERTQRDTDQAQRAEAERAIEAWTAEWSAIARTVIRDGRLRQQLGFGTPGRKPKSRAAKRDSG